MSIIKLIGDAPNQVSRNRELGDLAFQNAANIAGSITAGSINNTPIGSTTASTGKFTTVTASTGILFGTDTAAANTLDDYEEGTWTPTFSGWTSNPNVNGATYTKIGRSVTLTYVGNEGISVGGASSIGGLPFTSSSGQGASVTIKDISGSTVSALATISANSTQINSMTSATFTGVFWVFSTTYIV